MYNVKSGMNKNIVLHYDVDTVEKVPLMFIKEIKQTCHNVTIVILVGGMELYFERETGQFYKSVSLLFQDRTERRIEEHAECIQFAEFEF